IAYENGMEISKARNDVTNVPNKKGSAPYTLLTGSQVRPQKYFIPRDFIDGMDSRTSVRKRPMTSTNMATATTTNARRKARSVRTLPIENMFLTICIYMFRRCNYPHGSACG